MAESIKMYDLKITNANKDESMRIKIGQELKRYRREAGLTQRDVERALDIRTLSETETGYRYYRKSYRLALYYGRADEFVEKFGHIMYGENDLVEKLLYQGINESDTYNYERKFIKNFLKKLNSTNLYNLEHIKGYSETAQNVALKKKLKHYEQANKGLAIITILFASILVVAL